MCDLFFDSGQLKKTFVFGPSTSNKLTCMPSRPSIKVAKKLCYLECLDYSVGTHRNKLKMSDISWLKYFVTREIYDG